MPIRGEQNDSQSKTNCKPTIRSIGKPGQGKGRRSTFNIHTAFSGKVSCIL